MTHLDVSRSVVRSLVSAVFPCDAVERKNQADVLAWIDAGSPLYRVRPPAEPPKHLAVYMALFDDVHQTVMMVDHRKARAWLLPGGHVDADEDPRRTVVREADEELQLIAKFHDLTGDSPLFLSVTETRGAGSHLDVTLWFLLNASQQDRFVPDAGEFADTRWLPLHDTNWAADHFDPNMARFAGKLAALILGSTSA